MQKIQVDSRNSFQKNERWSGDRWSIDSTLQTSTKSSTIIMKTGISIKKFILAKIETQEKVTGFGRAHRKRRGRENKREFIYIFFKVKELFFF